MIDLVQENHDEMFRKSNIISQVYGFNYANLVSSFRGSINYQKLDSVMCIFSNVNTSNVLFEKKIFFFAYDRKIRNLAHLPNLR